MYKQAIVVRTDLEMSTGKAAAQAAHAAIGAAEKTGKIKLLAWRKTGQKKIVLGVSSEKAITDLAAKCRKLKIPHFIVADAGLTEVSPGTITAIGIGPDKDDLINKATSSLPLLK